MNKEDLILNYNLCLEQFESMRNTWLDKEWTIESEMKYQNLKSWVLKLENMINNYNEERIA